MVRVAVLEVSELRNDGPSLSGFVGNRERGNPVRPADCLWSVMSLNDSVRAKSRSRAGGARADLLWPFSPERQSAHLTCAWPMLCAAMAQGSFSWELESVSSASVRTCGHDNGCISGAQFSPVIPGHPACGAGGKVLGMALQFGQVIEGISSNGMKLTSTSP